MKTLLITLIRLYQKTLSPDHSWLKARYPYGYCKFHPTCSMYAIEALRIHGSGKGLFLGMTRILRCHPWAKPRVDQVPQRD